MAEKVEIVDLTINVDRANQDTRALKIAVQQLKEESDRLKETQGELSDEYIESQAALKSTKTELRANERLTQNVIAANNANTGSIQQMRKQLSVVSVQWAKLSKEERENTEEGKRLTAQKLRLTNALKKEERATGDARRNVGNYNESISRSIGLTGQFVPAVGRAANAARALGQAFTVALGPIGLIVAAIGLVIAGLKAFFTASEEGQDAWDSFGSTASVVTDNIIDKLSDFGEALLEPKELISDIGDFFSRTFGDVLLGSLQLAGNNIKKFFNNIDLQFQKFLDLFSDNSEEIDRAQKNIEKNNKAIAESNARITSGLVETTKAYNDVTDAVKEFNEEQLKEIAIANRLAKQQASLNRQIRGSLVANAKDQAEIARLRAAAAEKEQRDAEERLDLLNQAIDLEEKILKRNLSIAQQKLFIKAEQNKLSKSTREDLDEEARLRADVFNVRKTNFLALRKLESERQTALREIRAEEEKAIKEQARAEIDALIEVAETDKQLQADIDAINKQVAESARQQKEQAAAQRQVDFDNELAIAQDNAFRTLELQRQALEQQEAQEIEFAEKIGASTTLIQQKFSKAREAISKAEQEAKFAVAAGFFGNLATLAGEGTAIAKAAGVAETTINTFKAAQGAYAALAPIPIVGPALGVVAAGAAVATGIANVKKILSVDSGLPGGSSVNSSVPSASNAAQAPQRPGAVAPSLNQGIVSRDALSNITDNQISIQPTLVVDDVTSKQLNENANSTTSVI
jgi:hypothetical protein